MKTNFPFLALFLCAFHIAPDLCASPVGELPFAFPDEYAQIGIGEELYYSPAHPGLALEEPRPGEIYPYVNASLA